MKEQTELTKAQLAALEKQRQDIDSTFANVAGLLNKHRGLDRLSKKKLTAVMNFLNKASNTIASMTEDADDEEGDDE